MYSRSFFLSTEPLSDFSISAIQGLVKPPNSSECPTKSIATMTRVPKQDKSISPMDMFQATMRKEAPKFHFEKVKTPPALTRSISPLKMSYLSGSSSISLSQQSHKPLLPLKESGQIFTATEKFKPVYPFKRKLFSII